MSRHFTHDGPGTPAADWSARPEWMQVPALLLTGPDAPQRAVVAAAHPDDESLGAGGLIARLLRAGIPVTLVLATAGERSHPRSPTLTPTELAARRTDEAHAAWAALGGDPADVELLSLPDGSLAAHEDDLTRRLVEVVGDGRHTLLVTPWRDDGHPDHDALGRAGCRAAARTAARLLQYPIWFWHRADPATAPWARLRQLTLTPDDRSAKADAVAAHRTQIAALSSRPGDEVLLQPAFLDHFAGSAEAYVAEPPADEALDELHDEHADPWGTTSRWYERRKRDLLLAMLPRRRFDRGLDVGCSTGTLTAVLADRCDELVAVDRSPHALQAARRPLGDAGHVVVREMRVPEEWPSGSFDLVVVSESGYFLSPLALDLLVERVRGALAPYGVVVLAHWRHPVVGWPLSGPAVHARFTAAEGLPGVAARYVDRDVEILVLAADEALPDPGA